jgi:tetratricopeptide (TPR) repeat protein
MSETEVQGPTEAKMNQALGWLRSHLVNHAEITFRQILAAEPGNLTAQRLHGIALFKLGRRDEGIAAIAAAAEQDSGNARAWADLAVALRDAGRTEAAEQAFARALAAQAPNPATRPLESQAFCSELGQHEFKLIDYPYRAEVRYGAGRPAHAGLASLIGEGRARYHDRLTEWGRIQPDFADIPLGGT